MSHLDKLKALLAEKISSTSEPSKPPKAPFDPFDGAPPACIFSIEPDPGARYRWLIVAPDGRCKEVCTLPEMTAAELAPCYPGARLLPLPDAAAEAVEFLDQHAKATANAP